MKQITKFGLFCFTLIYIAQSGCSSQESHHTYSKTTREMQSNSIGMKFVWIPPGDFMMGSPSTEENRDSDEGPVHRVKITKGFWMGVFEVTEEQYRAVMGSRRFDIKKPNRPANVVSWNDAVEFCRKLSEKESKTYRLPTEAEWEYACRAGTKTAYNWGEKWRPGICNADKHLGTLHSDKKLNKFQRGYRTVSVGSFQPNVFGLYDMHGNVYEWCQDVYDENYYSNSPAVDPKGPSSGSYRVLRGGSFASSPEDCRSASRYGFPIKHSTIWYGFRVICLEKPELSKGTSIGMGTRTSTSIGARTGIRSASGIASATAYAVDNFQAGALDPPLEYPKGSMRVEGKDNLIKIHKGVSGYIIEAGSKFNISNNNWVITINDVIMNTGQEVINMHSLKINQNDYARMVKDKDTGSYKLEKINCSSTAINKSIPPKKSSNLPDTSASDNKTEVQVNQNDAVGYVKQGNVYYNSEQYNKAISEYSKAIELDPGFAIAYFNRGNAYVLSRRYEQAKKDLLKALELNPTIKPNIKLISDTYNLNLKLD